MRPMTVCRSFATLRSVCVFLVATLTLSALDLRAPLGEIIVTTGSGTSTVTSIIENPDGTLSLEAEQSGRLAHIGSFSAIFSYLAKIDYNTGTTLISGGGTLQNAQGDRLFVTVNIAEVGIDYPRPYTGVLTVTGGTGRFARATGLLEVTGIDEESLTDHFLLSGAISTLVLGN